VNEHVRHPELIASEKSVALSPDKPRALQTEALRLAAFVAKGEIAKPDAVDALYGVAEGLGLLRTKRDREDIEHLIGQGLVGRETLLPKKNDPQPKAATEGQVGQVGHLGRLRAPSGASATVRLRCMSEIAPEPVNWLRPGRLAAGKVALLFGEPGIGKSQISLEIAARISTGAEWPDGGNAQLGDVVILSSEDGLADTVRPRLDAAGADVSRIHVVETFRNETGAARTFNLAADLDALEREIGGTKGNVRLVIIDPVTSYMGRIDSHRTTDVRGVLEPLAAFAERLGVAVLGISHPPKSTPARAMNAVTGSGAYVAFARSVFLVVAEPDTDRRLLLPVKNSLAGHPAGLGFDLDERDPGNGSRLRTWSGPAIRSRLQRMKRLPLQQRPKLPTMPSRRPKNGWLTCLALDRSRPTKLRSKRRPLGSRNGPCGGQRRTLVCRPVNTASMVDGGGICRKPPRRRPRMPKVAKKISWPPSRDRRSRLLSILDHRLLLK
jgi:AAA domain-containing protein